MNVLLLFATDAFVYWPTPSITKGPMPRPGMTTGSLKSRPSCRLPSCQPLIDAFDVAEGATEEGPLVLDVDDATFTHS